jgi:hypothetical protein
MNIYLETSLWNALCDQSVDAEGLMESLGSKNSNLVFSHHCGTEMAKTFLGYGQKAVSRGRQLFSCLARFVSAGVACAKQNMELLPEELSVLHSRTGLDPFISAEEYTELKRQINKLADGRLDEESERIVRDRSAFAQRTRRGQVDHFETRDDMKQELKSIRPGDLPKWLDAKTTTPAGAAMLTYHIVRIFPDAPPADVFEYAEALLAHRAFRFAKGVIRADLYYNWRCANRDSNPPDLVDDMFHVLNAMYCDVYATKDKKQREYAGLLLTSSTKVAIYNGGPVDQWLLELA